MTRQTRFNRLARRLGTWFGGDGEAKELAAFRELNDHLLRDVGIWRERSAGPRRYDPWM